MVPQNDLPKRDSGLQPERTGLAWSRTGFLAMLVALLSARIGLATAEVVHLCAALLLAIVAGLLFHHGHQCGAARNTCSSDIAIKRNILRLTSIAIITASLLQAMIVLWHLLNG